jgi:Ca-activated chloride channel homolog
MNVMKHFAPPLSILVLLLLSLVFVASPAAAQEIIVPPTQPGVFTDPNWLRIDFHRVDVDIDQQIATTAVDLQFTNTGDALAEGTFLFPLPTGAAVDQLTMIIDGIPYDAKILEAGEARAIYDEIVRQYRDPALLEYVGTNVIQANVFPIPAGDSRRIQITYSQLLTVENGLVKYEYPMSDRRMVDSVSISVNVNENQAIGTIYSPSHSLAAFRDGDNAFNASYESSTPTVGNTFTLYYGFEQDTVSTNLLTYRESADQDGFFLLLVQPPVEVEQDTIVPKDVILVVDQSGSMDGEKWSQAQQAAGYVLDNLNPQDRFNLIVFSSGTRIFGTELQESGKAETAKIWLNGLTAEGGTNISDALTQALGTSMGERPTAVLFMTDGEATEGILETEGIIDALKNAEKPNTRIFTFGVGDDVNTVLLDSITREFHGTGTYVRPNQKIEEEVAALYNKIDAPVLSNVAIQFEGVTAELMYPTEVSDLFAGQQITLVGRYRNPEGAGRITISGTVDGEERTFVYDNLTFQQQAGGQDFIARLWATRRIADLLNTIRINGESEELVDSIVSLSLRYGIITPYTSFLIEEDDILTQQGREQALTQASEDFDAAADEVTGSVAVDRASQLGEMAEAEVAMPMLPAATQSSAGGMGTPSDGTLNVAPSVNALTAVGDKTFITQNGVWTDTTFTPDTMETQKVVFLSDEYFALLAEKPELAEYFALGDRVIVVHEGVAYEVTAEVTTETTAEPTE